MNAVEWSIIAAAATGFVIWVRGCFRSALPECWLALLLLAVACTAYFIVFSLTRTAYLATILFCPFLLAILPCRRLLTRSSGKLLISAVIILAGGAALTEYKLISSGNALLVIEPYRSGKGWRFDEPLLHLKGEPFVQGIPEMIDIMVVGIPGSERKVRLIFSQRPFPGANFRLDRRREQDGGNWYYNEQYNIEGWLCPALFKFFPRAPQHIYVKAEAA
jgi:hypothetical protein